jgi:hypothetical protein
MERKSLVVITVRIVIRVKLREKRTVCINSVYRSQLLGMLVADHKLLSNTFM